ncbi:MAG: hypothetical protein EHM21_15295, partial [Chloroflexi bacterium]
MFERYIKRAARSAEKPSSAPAGEATVVEATAGESPGGEAPSTGKNHAASPYPPAPNGRHHNGFQPHASAHPEKNIPAAPLIRLRQVTRSFETATGEFQALKGVDLDIYPGEF